MSCKPTGQEDDIVREAESSEIQIIKTETPTTSQAEDLSTTVDLSTYDDPQYSEQLFNHHENLNRLSKNNIFVRVHQFFTAKLEIKHRKYFLANPDLELLSIAAGDLFHDANNDHAFFVYDRYRQRGIFILYRESTDQYFDLYSDMQVENALRNSHCGYSSFGTLDYQFAEEIIYQEELLTKNPQLYVENNFLKITNLDSDDDISVKDGCFSSEVPRNAQLNSLCISTSSIYNNWECLNYDRVNDRFVIIYGQAFAD